jgi:hypothetical protein
MDVVSPANVRNTDPLVSPGVVCVHCGYDLRGLDARGRCPECGQEIAPSVRWWELQRREARPLSASDRRWVRWVSEGALIAVVAFALAAALAFAPPWAFEWKSPQRRWSLGVACTAWVFSCWAAWRLSEREPTATPAAAGSRWLLRWCTVAYLAGPFIAEFAPQYNAGAGWAFLIFGSLIAGLIATGAWFAYAGHFAQREGWRGMRLEADLLIPLSGFVFLLAFMPVRAIWKIPFRGCWACRWFNSGRSKSSAGSGGRSARDRGRTRCCSSLACCRSGAAGSCSGCSCACGGSRRRTPVTIDGHDLAAASDNLTRRGGHE